MAFSTGYTLGFATAVCVGCSLLVGGAALSLKEQQDLNVERDLKGSVLEALDIRPESGEATGEWIDQAYGERVEVKVINAAGAVQADKTLADVEAAQLAVKGSTAEPDLFAVYARKDGGNVGAYALPLDGVGLWGPLSGYLALKPDAATVLGATFFAPKETPGLGAEITQPKFKEQWAGKKVVDGGQPRTIRVVKGEAKIVCPGATDYCVDGVSGATITGDGVDKMVAEALEQYEPYLKSLRGGK
ncbi:MAG: NADH:ubiquinone reductase (Na(+)-transporting) subunit C [Deltaproteobacteria bacterium]|nr:MAG: NADH:ubiquinone reductase (Na(+)-transporting) subunit C [Deltaproteobacteria bacterium]